MPLYTHSAVLLSKAVRKYWLCGLNGIVNPFRIARALRAEQPQEQWDGLAFAELGVHCWCAVSQLFTRGQHYTWQSVIILQQRWERFLMDFLCARTKLGWKLRSNLLQVRGV